MRAGDRIGIGGPAAILFDVGVELEIADVDPDRIERLVVGRRFAFGRRRQRGDGRRRRRDVGIGRPAAQAEPLRAGVGLQRRQRLASGLCFRLGLIVGRDRRDDDRLDRVGGRRRRRRDKRGNRVGERFIAAAQAERLLRAGRRGDAERQNQSAEGDAAGAAKLDEARQQATAPFARASSADGRFEG